MATGRCMVHADTGRMAFSRRAPLSRNSPLSAASNAAIRARSPRMAALPCSSKGLRVAARKASGDMPKPSNKPASANSPRSTT
jgi:hypothetical protein